MTNPARAVWMLTYALALPVTILVVLLQGAYSGRS